MPENLHYLLSINANLAPGDVVVLTALVRDLDLAYGPALQVAVDTPAPTVWDQNPHTRLAGAVQWPDAIPLRLDYGLGLRAQNHETIHFLTWFHRDFEQKTGIRVPVTAPCPDLHLSAFERAHAPVTGRYWVVVAGGKTDITTKIWAATRFQETVDRLRRHGLQFVQAGASGTGHWHPVLGGVLNLVGQTTLRNLIRLIAHADGVICGVTAAMHIAAALSKPCVVLAGGREAWWWEAYVRENRGLGCPQQLSVPHRYLHTIGLLPCCPTHGCWRRYVTPQRNSDQICQHPVALPTQTIPKCLELITPEQVAAAVLSYYEDGTLTPIESWPTTPTRACLPSPP